MSSRVHPDVRTLDIQKKLDYLTAQYEKERSQV